MIDASALYPSATPAAAAPAPVPAGTSAADVLYGAKPTAQVATPATQPAPPAAQPTPAPTAKVLPDEGQYVDSVEFKSEAEAQAETAQPMTAEQVASAIEAAIPDDIKVQRESDEARKLYNPQTTFAKLINPPMPDMDPEVRDALVYELREIVADVGFTAADIPDLAGAMKNPPTTPEQIDANREEAIRLLNTNFGTGAKQAYADALAFVAADPRRAGLLAHAGNDPRTVLRVAQLARAAKVAGRK